MKFGAVPLDKAEGAILAHSLRLKDGRLRKGVMLSREHVAALREAGMQEVSVARLEDGDIHEDTAAQALAQALSDGADGIHCTSPFTGRVNLIADGPGVVLIDAARINAVNAVDPMITVATVAPFHQLQAGGMAATVKIIAYGVAGAALSKASTHARGAIRLAAPVHDSASLILTEITGGPGDKGVEAVENRLKGLGMRLCETLRCAHDEAALADAIGKAAGDVMLILTASATSDPHDTAPSALIRAGGRIERFGLPVDPGNLLFLGDIAGRPVIGLPGSARSPVLHGADWVLARIACGVALDSAGMAAMGVGGLLKEIPTRPQPRQPGMSRAPREDGTN